MQLRMALSQSSLPRVWVANARGDLHLHCRLQAMHTRLDHRGELGVEEERRPKRLVFLHVLDDVAHLPQILDAYSAYNTLFEELANAGFTELGEGAVLKLVEFLGPFLTHTR